MALRRGRQYLREISGNGVDFDPPHMIGAEIRSVIPWSRIFNDREMLLAINTDADNARAAWVNLDNDLHQDGGRLTCLYSTDSVQVGREIEIVDVKGDSAKAALVTVPAAGFVMYE